MKTKNVLCRFLLLCGLLFVVVGCANPPAKIQTIDFGSVGGSPKKQLRAAIVLDEALCQYQARYGNDRDPIGDALKTYAQAVVSELFEHVEVFPAAEQATGSADVIFIPKVVQSAQYRHEYSEIELVMEWTMKDRDNKTVLWMDQVGGKAYHPFASGALDYGSIFKNKQILFQKLMDDLGKKTLVAMQQAPEIRNLKK